MWLLVSFLWFFPSVFIQLNWKTCIVLVIFTIATLYNAAILCYFPSIPFIKLMYFFSTSYFFSTTLYFIYHIIHWLSAVKDKAISIAMCNLLSPTQSPHPLQILLAFHFYIVRHIRFTFGSVTLIPILYCFALK